MDKVQNIETGRRRGPKPVDPARKASEWVGVRLTPAERVRLRAAMAHDGVETSAEALREALDEYCTRRGIREAA
jgi:hypothetical protein